MRVVKGMGMVAETAVEVEVGNAPIEPEATPQDAPVGDAPETEAAGLEATEAALEPTPEPPADPLAGIDDDALANHPRVRDRLRREGESLRQRTERETETRIQSARAHWAASGQAFTDIQAALEQGNTQQAQAYIEAALNNRDWAAVSTLDRIGRQKLPEGKIEMADQTRLDEALWAAQNGRGTLETYVDTLIEVRAKAYAENTLAPQIEQRLKREDQTRQKAAATTASRQQAEATNAGRPGPTLGVPGLAAGRQLLTSAEVESIPTSVFLGLSKDVQTRLVAEARDADRLYPGRNDRNAVQAALGR